MKQISIHIFSLGIALMVSATASAADGNAAAVADGKTLVSNITGRNIFDPNRPHKIIGSEPPHPSSNWFSLQGTSRNDDVWAAFFNGTTPEFRKTLQCGDMIAGYKIAGIAADHVTLIAAANKTINLPIQAHISPDAIQPK